MPEITLALSELSQQILHYLFDRQGLRVSIKELELQLGVDVHTLRPAVEDLKLLGYINEEEYQIEILAAGRHFAQSRWV